MIRLLYPDMADDEEHLCHLIFDAEPEPAISEREWVAAPLPDCTLYLEPLQAFVWGSSLHLARWLLTNRDVVSGRSVAELGAGTGLPSLCARIAGARSVVGSDYDATAMAALSRAAQYNNIDCLQAVQLDWFDALRPGFAVAHDPVEVMLVADCNYYTRALDGLLATVLAYLLPGGTLLLASRVDRCSLHEFLERLQLHAAFSLTQSVIFREGDSQAIPVESVNTSKNDDCHNSAASTSQLVHQMWIFARANTIQGEPANRGSYELGT
ncbi:hypothetical protein AB1Y20_009418 [Prymnesium parvum]|uniref:Calmodulin-lysine N-methyltransferase n=1 Tax=Prymnesium parvum TaxID=97485 RepID=A0AB34K3W0_PRYPA